MKEPLVYLDVPLPSLTLYAMNFLVYMSTSFWLFRVESHDFSQAEKERTACKYEQIHKMTTIFTQNDNLGGF